MQSIEDCIGKLPEASYAREVARARLGEVREKVNKLGIGQHFAEHVSRAVTLAHKNGLFFAKFSLAEWMDSFVKANGGSFGIRAIYREHVEILMDALRGSIEAIRKAFKRKNYICFYDFVELTIEWSDQVERL